MSHATSINVHPCAYMYLIDELSRQWKDVDGHLVPAAKVNDTAQRGRDTPTTGGVGLLGREGEK